MLFSPSTTMICKIERIVDGYNVIELRIVGQLAGEHVETLRHILRQEAGELAMDLKEVSLVDREAVQLLALSEYNRTELRNCPAYIREWVTRERADLKEKRRPIKRRK